MVPLLKSFSIFTPLLVTNHKRAKELLKNGINIFNIQWKLNSIILSNRLINNKNFTEYVNYHSSSLPGTN